MIFAELSFIDSHFSKRQPCWCYSTAKGGGGPEAFWWGWWMTSATQTGSNELGFVMVFGYYSTHLTVVDHACFGAMWSLSNRLYSFALREALAKMEFECSIGSQFLRALGFGRQFERNSDYFKHFTIECAIHQELCLFEKWPSYHWVGLGLNRQIINQW